MGKPREDLKVGDIVRNVHFKIRNNPNVLGTGIVVAVIPNVPTYYIVKWFSKTIEIDGSYTYDNLERIDDVPNW